MRRGLNALMNARLSLSQNGGICDRFCTKKAHQIIRRTANYCENLRLFGELVVRKIINSS